MIFEIEVDKLLFDIHYHKDLISLQILFQIIYELLIIFEVDEVMILMILNKKTEYTT